MRVLVTGGFGFMGGWVTELFSLQGHEVFVLSRSSTGKKMVNPLVKPHFIEADIAGDDPAALAERLPTDIDACVHMASSNDGSGPQYGKEALLVNTLGTRNLLEALVLRHPDPNRRPLFLYASTFHVYGLQQGEITEYTPAHPHNDYAVSHYAAEEYCRFYSRAQKIPALILRCTNGFGSPKCEPFGKWNLLFNDLCLMAAKRGEVIVNSPPDTERDFVWMGDVAGAFEKLLTRKDLSGEAFNLSGATCKIGAVAQLIANEAAALMGKAIPLVLKSQEHSAARSCSALHVSSKKLYEAIGYMPTACMEQEVRKMFEFLFTRADAL